jgi:hypothetical protein
MHFELLCPACGAHDCDFDDYETLILLAPNLALVQFICSGCGTHLSATLKLAPTMQRVIQQRLNAEDSCTESPSAEDKEDVSHANRDKKASAVPQVLRAPHVSYTASTLSYASRLVAKEDDPAIGLARPYRVGNIDTKAHVEYFRRQLEVIDTVDQAIDEIDTGRYREKRDV